MEYIMIMVGFRVSLHVDTTERESFYAHHASRARANAASLEK